MVQYFSVGYSDSPLAYKITSDCPYSVISEYYFQDEDLHYLDLPFRIVKGIKDADKISWYRDLSTKFYSSRFVNVLKQFENLEKCYYPISIIGTDQIYWFPLFPKFKSIKLINLDKLRDNKEPGFFIFDNETPDVFLIWHTRVIAFSEKVKNELDKLKLKNVKFSECYYGVESIEEYERLRSIIKIEE